MCWALAKDHCWQIKLVWLIWKAESAATELNLVNPNQPAALKSQLIQQTSRNVQSLATQGTFRQLHTGVRMNVGFRWENLSAAPRFVLWPLGLTVNPITHSSQAPHSFQSTELGLFCLRMYFGLFYLKPRPWFNPLTHPSPTCHDEWDESGSPV